MSFSHDENKLNRTAEPFFGKEPQSDLEVKIQTDFETEREAEIAAEMEEVISQLQEKEDNQSNDHSGHRGRLHAKASKQPLTDHELLELLLFYAMPRRNTSDIAHNLLFKYKSLQAVLNASPKELKEEKWVGDNVVHYLKYLNELCHRYDANGNQSQLLDNPISYPQLLERLDGMYEKEMQEVVDVYLMDASSRIINSRRLAIGEFSEVEISPPQLAKFLVDVMPAGMIIVHNHPQGTLSPSFADERVTHKCQVLCSMFNIMFCDHIIYTDKQKFSYYSSGDMKPISKIFSIETIVDEKGEEYARQFQKHFPGQYSGRTTKE